MFNPSHSTSETDPSDLPCGSESLVKVEGIAKRFGDNRVLDGVTIDLLPGEAVAIIGPSGTGKSTILRVIAGLLAPDEGEVWVG
ncbi:ATP-binding cassette domain-containing protein, partial [cf. Phormidesmis sp. LEGE 11477]|uniref:ATP-binding cassette domain-containing protein n=1 Tax=cf. Phormidesmis sp. LEGE 11477 TaxID=1828680 RepID=UPI00187E8FB5